MRINSISFASNNANIQQSKKMTLPKKIESLHMLSNICAVPGIILGYDIFTSANKVTPKAKAGLAAALLLAWSTTFTFECINKHKYYKETGKVFDA